MVLVIIGLLLGAVLKGQELIASARVRNLISSVNGYKAAIVAFQDRYRMLPGNSSTAATKVGNGAINCTLWCDRGVIVPRANTSLVNNHLSAADFYSGPALTAETDTMPTSTGYLNNPGGGPIFAGTVGGAGSHHFGYATETGGGTSSSGATGVFTGWYLSSKLLGEVDRKTDDGNGWTGGMRLSQTGQGLATCVNSTTGAWIENSPVTNCHAFVMF